MRIRNFYKKATSMLSNDRLYAAVSYHGIGLYASKPLKPNEIAMEIPANYTISSFDRLYPLPELVDEVLEKHENTTSLMDIRLAQIILNINYLRYMNTTNRFFKIYFENLPKYRDYVPFWSIQEREILKKILNDPMIDGSLFSHNTTNLDILIEDIKKIYKKHDPNINMHMLTDNRVDEALNIANSRCFTVSYKGWKLINNKVEDLEESGILNFKIDIENYGYILVPGADGINHESIVTDHLDVQKSQVEYKKGKVLIKAGRKFKTGEEFVINYGFYTTVYDFFKQYG